MSVDRLSDALNAIKVNEMVGKKSCKVPATKLVRKVLEIFQAHGYIKSFSDVADGSAQFFAIELDGRINNCGTIKPRAPVKRSEWAKTEQKYIPAIGIGVLVVSTPKGVITNTEAQNAKIGGRLIAYVY